MITEKVTSPTFPNYPVESTNDHRKGLQPSLTSILQLNSRCWPFTNHWLTIINHLLSTITDHIIHGLLTIINHQPLVHYPLSTMIFNHYEHWSSDWKLPLVSTLQLATSSCHAGSLQRRQGTVDGSLAKLSRRCWWWCCCWSHRTKAERLGDFVLVVSHVIIMRK